jgi:hypothetical protein
MDSVARTEQVPAGKRKVFFEPAGSCSSGQARTDDGPGIDEYVQCTLAIAFALTLVRYAFRSRDRPIDYEN